MTDSTAENFTPEPPNWEAELSSTHLDTLITGTVSPSVVFARGYVSLERGNDAHAALLRAERFPKAHAETLRSHGGLLIPVYNPVGERVSAHYRPDEPYVGSDGKGRKYLMPFNVGTVLDVHPSNVDAIKDVKVPLYITEGVKKGDSLVSHGLCAVSLSGVWNWKREGAAHPDWENIPVKGRRVVFVFDADATENPDVARAQKACAVWMRDTKRADVLIAILPGEVDGVACKGVDDHFAAGFTGEDLEACLTKDIPDPQAVRPAVAAAAEESVRDDMIVAEVAENLMVGRYRYSAGLGWMEWSDPRWVRRANEAQILNEIKDHLSEWFDRHAAELHASGQLRSKAGMDALNTLRRVCGKGKWDMALTMCAGYDGVASDEAAFDADPDAINTPNGVVCLRTGTISPASPDMLMTKLSGCEYVPGATHADWDTALQALPDEATREWWQLRMGQALTGHVPPDDVMLFVQGHGSNGKSTVLDGIVAAFGDYFTLVSRKLLIGSQSDHPTESMTLRGARLAAIEELPEGRHLNLALLKSHVGTSKITAREMRRDNVTFEATHSLMVNTNYAPQVEETDHGTWRRLCMVRFPFTYRKPGERCDGPFDRRGDGNIRQRVKQDPRVHEAVLSWLVEGAMRWYAMGMIMPPPPTDVEETTNEWRRTSDLLMGYLDERMVLDKNAHVGSTELLKDVNAYLEERSHRPWSEKLLASRIDGHALTRHVTKLQVRGTSGGVGELSRPPGSVSRMPERYTAYIGLRFRIHGESDGRSPFDDPSPFGPVDTPPFDGTVPSDCPDTNEGDTVIESKDDVDRVNPVDEIADLFHEPPRVVAFDIETPDADELFSWDASRGPYVRLCGYSVDGSVPVSTTDVKELLTVLEGADEITAHNGIGFDLMALARHNGADFERLVSKTKDTMILARTEDPPGSRGTTPAGWYGLDSIGERILGAGKHGDLGVLKNEFDGYHNIPVDDPRYVDYLRRDVTLQNAAHERFPWTDYGRREHEVMGIFSAMTLRGVRMDVPLIHERAAEEETRKREALATLGEEWGLPLREVTECVTVTRVKSGAQVTRMHEREAVIAGETSYLRVRLLPGDECGKSRPCGDAGCEHAVREEQVEIDPADYTVTRTEKTKTYDSPFATTAGKQWFAELWARFGVTNPPRTEKGNLSTKGVELEKVRDHVKCPAELRGILDLVTTAQGARVVYATMAKHLVGDMVHPRVTADQASGRFSLTRPGVSVTGKRAGRSRERAPYLPRERNHRIVACDFDQVDARAVAVHSQSPNYMDLFVGDLDFHSATALAVFGDASMREQSKPIGHGVNYGMGINSLVEKQGVRRDLAEQYMRVMRERFPEVIEWQERVRAQARRGEFLDNGFGRKLKVNPEFAHTQAPAFVGQSCTRDLMTESILRMPKDVQRMIMFTVHDEIVFSIPEDVMEPTIEIVRDAMTFLWKPYWMDESAREIQISCGVSKPGKNWADCYAK